ncbi:hypothetical protein [Nocardia mexicana]|uniref:Uncharacterized protein n=1 Tax=Nocardia mexicana TaxID=279262 RepID=A0A370GQD4_9NOCA|nr:hypothetical protein [Nocardia mexicana]RDI44694.1 hypothetical protein DFR68_11684 [Nocardia mexicana]
MNRVILLGGVTAVAVGACWLLLGPTAGGIAIGVVASVGATMVFPQVVNVLRGRRLVSAPGDAPLAAGAAFLVVTCTLTFAIVYFMQPRNIGIQHYRNQSLTDESGRVQMFAVAYDGRRFLAVGSAAPRANGGGRYQDAALWESADGWSWSRLPHDIPLLGGVAVTGGSARRQMGDVIATSDGFLIFGFDTVPDGKLHGQTWKLPRNSRAIQRAEGVKLPAADWFSGYSRHDDTEILLGGAGGNSVVWRRVAGGEWSHSILGLSRAVDASSVRYVNGDWVIAGSDRSSDPDFRPQHSDDANRYRRDGAIWMSGDGLQWRKAVGFAGVHGRQNVGEVAYVRGMWIAVGSDDSADPRSNDGAIWASDNGRSWRRVQERSLAGVPEWQQMDGLVEQDDHLLVVGTASPELGEKSPNAESVAAERLWENGVWRLDLPPRKGVRSWSNTWHRLVTWLG